MFKQVETKDDGDIETIAFEADVPQLMSLIIDTFYSNKDIFLRELISNSSDAVNKIRHESATDPSKGLLDNKELCIKIIPNKNDRTLTIIDTGIGMTKTEMIKNLGIIGRSGTKTFATALKADADVSMIGQFGLGFYSAYLVANKVTVTSKHNDDEQYLWESNANGWFTIRHDCSEPLGRGTKIVLYIKDDHLEYLEESKIKEIIEKHSLFVKYPIILLVQKEIDEDEAMKNKKQEKEDEKQNIETVEENEEEGKDEKKKKKRIEDTEYVLNKLEPIMIKDISYITQTEHNEFYKLLSRGWEKYFGLTHLAIQDQLKFKILLYIPHCTPSNLLNRTDTKKKNGISLYVKQIFIMDNCEELIPDYLNFIIGIVDSKDLPLNISREMLQQSKALKIIRSHIVKYCFQLFEYFTKNTILYAKFYKQFSCNIKLGIYEDSANRDRLTQLLRYHTSVSGDEMCSLQDYVNRMKKNQKYIYFIIGENMEQIKNSVFTERVKKCGIEVIYMTDSIDEFVVEQIKYFDEKRLMSVAKEGLELPEDEIEKKKRMMNTAKFEKLCRVMENILSDKVEKVVVSNRLVKSPCCIVTSRNSWTTSIERIIKLKILRNIEFTDPIRQFEINPNHIFIQDLLTKVVDNTPNKYVKHLVTLLFETALLLSGLTLEDPQLYGHRVYNLINLGSINKRHGD